jgi:hypothetical protein
LADNKESAQIAIHLICHDKAVAEPAQTMKKVKCFMMSNFLHEEAVASKIIASILEKARSTGTSSFLVVVSTASKESCDPNPNKLQT